MIPDGSAPKPVSQIALPPQDESGKELVPSRVAPPELQRWVRDFCEAKVLRKRITSLLGLIGWMRKKPSSAADLAGLAGFVEYLETGPERRSHFQTAFANLLSEMNCVPLFAEAGIPSDHSLISEVGLRISGRLLPSARELTDAAKVLVTLYPNQRTAQRFLATPPELFRQLIEAVTPATDPDFAHHEYLDLQEALRLLASRVSALGLKPEVRSRSSSSGVAESPFYQLQNCTEELLVASRAQDIHATLDRWHSLVQRCRGEMVHVHQHMENAGVSVELIFDLRKIAACLSRMESIVDVLDADDHSTRLVALQGLLAQLLAGRLADLSLSSLLRENLNLIARKMVERTGHSGEHYIAHNRVEYWRMWAAALGG